MDFPGRLSFACQSNIVRLGEPVFCIRVFEKLSFIQKVTIVKKRVPNYYVKINI